MELNLNLRKTIQWLCYYILPAFMLIVVMAFQILSIDNYEILSNFGSLSLNLILILLFIKPLSVIFDKISILKTILSYRREMGVLAFWLAMFHAILLIFYLNLFSINNLPYFTSPINHLFWALLATISMFILGVTSNTLSAIKFKQNWKKIQSIAYLALAFVLIHKALVKNEIEPYFIIILFIILKIIEKYLIKKRLNEIQNKPKIDTENLNTIEQNTIPTTENKNN